MCAWVCMYIIHVLHIYIYICMWYIRKCVCVHACIHAHARGASIVHIVNASVYVYTLHVHLPLYLCHSIYSVIHSAGWFLNDPRLILWCKEACWISLVSFDTCISVWFFHLLTISSDPYIYRHICLWMSVEQRAFVRALAAMIMLVAPPQLQQV